MTQTSLTSRPRCVGKAGFPRCSSAHRDDHAVQKEAPKDTSKSKGGKATDDVRRALAAATLRDAALDYSAYGRLTSLISPLEAVKPKPKTLVWLMRLVEEIVSAPPRRQAGRGRRASHPSSPPPPLRSTTCATPATRQTCRGAQTRRAAAPAAAAARAPSPRSSSTSSRSATACARSSTRRVF